MRVTYEQIYDEADRYKAADEDNKLSNQWAVALFI